MRRSDGFICSRHQIEGVNSKSAFVLEDSNRLALFNDLVKDQQTVRTLIRKNRMPENLARKALDSMEEEGLVIREGDRYQLTIEGKDLVNEVRSLERRGASAEGVGKSIGKRRIAEPRYKG
jgi:predicted transcriptional regulator